MKLFSIFLILGSINLFANDEYKEEIRVIDTLIPVYDINCILPQGREEHIYTSVSPVIITGRDSDDVEMKHQRATLPGCDSEAIAKLLLDSQMDWQYVQ